MVSEDRREWRVNVIIVKRLEPAAGRLTLFDRKRGALINWATVKAMLALSEVIANKPIVPRLQKNKGKRWLPSYAFSKPFLTTI